ncbi:MAG: hypothetical protein K2I30_00230 [Clostridia bacterium]|nr:hypothetical protein [Clostridia bacterium]
MKTQMRFQKILMLVTLIVAALSFVYALSFCSGTVYQYSTLYLQSSGKERVPGAADLFLVSQYDNGILINLSIVFIVVTVLHYIAASQKRRKYYVTNYVATGIVVVYQLVFAILLIVYVSEVFSLFNAIDRVAAEAAYLRDDFKYSTINFIMGYVLVGVVVLNMVALVLNLVWKIKLMQGEKKLLQGAKLVASVEGALESQPEEVV